MSWRDRGSWDWERLAAPRVKHIIDKLAQVGWTIRADSGRDYDAPEYWLVSGEGERVLSEEIEQLIRDGWLESFNGGYRLSDAGRQAYMRSTDELRDGKLYVPVLKCDHKGTQYGWGDTAGNGEIWCQKCGEKLWGKRPADETPHCKPHGNPEPCPVCNARPSDETKDEQR